MESLDETLFASAAKLDFGGDKSEEKAPEPVAAEAHAPEVSEAPEGQEPASAAPEAVEAHQQEPDDEPSAPPEEPKVPSGWTAKTKEKWASLDADVKAEVLKREADFHKGIAEYKEHANKFKAIEKAYTPYLANIQSSGVPVEQAISNLMGLDHALRHSNPEQKTEILRRVAQMYQVNPADLAKQPDDQPYVDPEIAKVQAKIQEMERREQQAQEAAAIQQIQAFATAEGHEHFEQVKEDMRVFLLSGKAADLQQAYDMAIWANPSTREIVIAKQREAARKAEAARIARKGNGVNVGKRGTLPATSRKPTSLDDTLWAKVREQTEA